MEDGTAELSITCSASSASLVNFYKKSFGFSESTTYIDSEIPQNTTRIVTNEVKGETSYREIIEPVREKFYDGIREEQKFLFGFEILEFDTSHVISKQQDELQIFIEAHAVPYFTEIHTIDSKTTFTITSPPEKTVNDFLYAQMDISRALLYNMPTAQDLKKSWDLTIHLPENGQFMEVEGRTGVITFDGDASLTSSLEKVSDNTVHYTEEWKVTENHLSRESIDVDQAYSLPVQLSSTVYDGEQQVVMEFSHGDFRDELWNWSFDWDVIEFSGSYPVEYDISVNLYLTLIGSVHVDLGETAAWAEFDVSAGLEINAEIHAGWEHTFPIDLGFCRGDSFGWRGMIPVVVTIQVEPEAELYVSVEGYIIVYVNPEAGFNLKAGADADFQWGWPPVEFHPIFEFTPYCDFDNYDFDIGAEVTIRPKLAFAVSVLVDYIIGPRITPGVYLEGVLGYSLQEGIYWHAKLGFDLMVGVQLTPFLHWNWPDPLFDITLMEWDSGEAGGGNPEDTEPPVTTVYLQPLVGGYPGWQTNFWFVANDEGADASGIERTLYNIPEYHGYDNWQEFNEHEIIPLLTHYPEYDVNYYSIDLEENEESINTLTITPDLTAPVSILQVGKVPQRDEVVVYAEQTPVMIEAEDDYTGYEIYYTTWNESCGWGDWRNGTTNESVTHYFSYDDLGTCFLYWFSIDGAGNLENNQSEVFYVTTPDVVLVDVKMCEYPGGPPTYEFDYGQECFCEIVLDNAVEGEVITWMWKLDGDILYVDNTVVTSPTCWNSWTPSLAGEWTVSIYYDYTYLGSSSAFHVIEGPEASLEYTCMCDNPGGPPETEFDFGQECISYCEFDNSEEGDTVKWKWVWGDDEQIYYTAQETITDASIWCSWTPPFSGDWYVNIYYNDVYVGTGPVFLVKEPLHPKGIITDFTVEPNPVEYAGDTTATVQGINIGEISGWFAIGIETATHGSMMSEPTELPPGQSMDYEVVFEDITQSTYCNATLWWLSDYIINKGNDRDQILQDEEQLYIDVASQDVIGEYNESSSDFFSGPFHNQEQGRSVAKVYIKNIGMHEGTLHLCLYEYPDTPEQNVIFSKEIIVDSGTESHQCVWTDISDGPEQGLWPMGLKVWGDTEAEPIWGTAKKTHQWNVEILAPHEPSIITLDTTNIKETNVVLNAQCLDDGGEPCSCGFWYGTEFPVEETNSINVTCDETVQTSECCDHYVNELTPGILYYAKSWIRNLEGFYTSYNTISFHTLTFDADPPTVITNTTEQINETTVAFQGFLYDNGGEPCSCGFWYGTEYPLNETNSISVECDEEHVTGDEFSTLVTLRPIEPYYVCSWAANSHGLSVSNVSRYDHEFGDYSYTFDESNRHLGDDIPYTHSIEFPLSIWFCNGSIAVNNSVENFLQQGSVWTPSNCVFHNNEGKEEWTSWKKWRYEQGLPNSLTDIEPEIEYYFYLNDSALPVTIAFEFDDYIPIFYDIVLPSRIWAYNTSIGQNDSCENFCQQGGIWDDIYFIDDLEGHYWFKGGSDNTLTHLTYGKEYKFMMLNKSEVAFEYDQGTYDAFGSNFPPEDPLLEGPNVGYTSVDYLFSTSTTDQEEHQIYYNFSWDDESSSGWLGPYDSGQVCECAHAWESIDTYGVKVKAKDILDAESDWSNIIFITIKKPGDVDGNGVVNVVDLLALLAAWGTSDPNADINGDGTVDVIDLLILLAHWG